MADRVPRFTLPPAAGAVDEFRVDIDTCYGERVSARLPAYRRQFVSRNPRPDKWRRRAVIFPKLQRIPGVRRSGIQYSREPDQLPGEPDFRWRHSSIQ